MTSEANDTADDADGNTAVSDKGGVGHRRPPKATRFQKGKSGNPAGRPRGRKTALPYDAVLGQTVTIREDGSDRRVTAEEAFLLHTAKSGLEGDGAAARAALTAIADARSHRLDGDPETLQVILRNVSVADVIVATESVGMAQRLDPYGTSARSRLEPWLVEAALQRLGPRQLTPEEQKIVWKATRTPKKVKWPRWWVVTG